jgi:hypothetical protein
MPERRLSFLLISPLFTLSLAGLILILALSYTIGQPQQAQDLVHKSRLYNAVLPAQLSDMQKSNPSLASLPLSDQDLQRLLGYSVDSGIVQSQGDKAIDDIYAWLEGKNMQPRFTISIMPDRESLANMLGELARQHAESLPVCQSLADVPSDIAAHPMEATCLPPGITANTIKEYVIGEVNTDPSFSADSIISSDDIKMPNGKPVLVNFSSAPVWYQRAQKLPIILAVLAVICALLLLTILRPGRGIKSIGKHLLAVGITLSICALALTWAIDWAFNKFVPKSSNPTINDALIKLTSVFDAAYRNNIIRLSVYFAVAGAVLYAIGFVLNRSRRTPVASTAKKEDVKLREPDILEKAPPVATFTPAGPPALPSALAAKPAKAKSEKKPVRHKKAPAAHKPATHRKKKPQ